MTKGLVRANNFSDLTDKDQAVANLGLSSVDYAALKGLYTTAGIDFAVIGEIGNSQGNYQAQLDGVSSTFSGIVLSGYVNRSGNSAITGNWSHSGIIDIVSGLPSGYPASTDSLFSLSIENGEAVIVASGLIASGLSYNGVRQSSSTVQRALPPSGFSPLHLIPLQVGGQGFFAEAGESPSFHIAPARLGHALDLVTGNLIGAYNSASPATAVGPDGLLFTPAANAPVIEYNPTTRACLGARIWGVVTNLLRQSSDFTTTWAASNAIVSANAATAPDQTNTADQFSPTINGVSTQRTLRQDVSTTANDTYTLSVFVKVNTATTNGIALLVQDQSGANNFRCNFNLFTLTTGAAGLNWATPTASIIAYPNGWYRCSLTGVTSTAHTSLRCMIYLNLYASVPDTVGSVFLWGAQLNTGPLAPYVPTGAVSASSTADAWSITGADFNRIYNPSAASVFIEGQDFADGGRIYFDDNTSGASDRWDLRLAVNATQWGIRSRSSGVDDGTAVVTPNTSRFRVAGAIAQNSMAISLNGSAVVSDTSLNMPQNIEAIWIGSFRGLTTFANGYIRESAIFRSRRPNANLQAIAL